MNRAILTYVQFLFQPKIKHLIRSKNIEFYRLNESKSIETSFSRSVSYFTGLSGILTLNAKNRISIDSFWYIFYSTSSHISIAENIYHFCRNQNEKLQFIWREKRKKAILCFIRCAKSNKEKMLRLQLPIISLHFFFISFRFFQATELSL